MKTFWNTLKYWQKGLMVGIFLDALFFAVTFYIFMDGSCKYLIHADPLGMPTTCQFMGTFLETLFSKKEDLAMFVWPIIFIAPLLSVGAVFLNDKIKNKNVSKN